MLARWEGRTTAPAALARDMVEKRGWMSVTVRTAAAVCPRACRVRYYVIEAPGALDVLGVPIASIAKFPSRCELLPSRRSWDARSVRIFCSRMHGF